MSYIDNLQFFAFCITHFAKKMSSKTKKPSLRVQTRLKFFKALLTFRTS